MSNSLQLHGLQSARLLCPPNSPGRDSGVHSHSLLQGIFLTQGSNLGFLQCRQILYCLSHQGSPTFRYAAAAAESLLVMSDSVWPYGLQITRLICPQNSPSKSTGVGCHALLQGIFPTGSGIEHESPALQADSLPLSHQGSHKI